MSDNQELRATINAKMIEGHSFSKSIQQEIDRYENI